VTIIFHQEVDPHCLLARQELSSLWEVLHRGGVPESREDKGLRHRQATVLTIVFTFLLSGGQGGHRAIAVFAEGLSPTQRSSLRCWFNPRQRRYDVPTSRRRRCRPSSRPSGPGRRRDWVPRTGMCWCSMAKRCEAAGTLNWSGASTRGAVGPWESKSWPTRVTRFRPDKRFWNVWT